MFEYGGGVDVTSVVEGMSRSERLALQRALAEAELASAPPDDGVECLRLAEELVALTDLTRTCLVQIVAAVEDFTPRPYRAEGLKSATSWLEIRTGMRRGHAAELITLTKILPHLPDVSTALTSGALPFPTAAAIGQALSPVPDEDRGQGEAILLNLVAEGGTTTEVVRAGRVIKQVIDDVLNRPPDDVKRGYQRSRLSLGESLEGGLYLDGYLCPKDATALQGALSSHLRAKQEACDTRTRGERVADALIAVLTQGHRRSEVIAVLDLAALHHAGITLNPHTTTQQAAGPERGTAPAQPAPAAETTPRHQGPGGHGRDATPTRSEGADQNNNPTVDFSGSATGPPPSPSPADHTPPPRVPTAGNTALPSPTPAASTAPPRSPSAQSTTLSSSTQAHNTTPSSTPAGSPVPPRSPSPGSTVLPPAGRIIAATPSGTPVPVAEVQQLLRSCGLSLLLINDQGEPLYFGRTRRCASPQQRRVLEALYRTCAVEGCSTPAQHCEIHHLGPGGWNGGTPTDINRLVPACAWHNAWIDKHPNQCQQIPGPRGQTVIKIRSRRPARAHNPAA